MCSQKYLTSGCAATNAVATIMTWSVQNQKLSGHLEVQKLSKRLCQNNRRRATAKFRVKIFSLLFIALSVRMFILHLQSSTFFKTLCFWESQQKSSKACILQCWIQSAILKWLHSTMFLVFLVLNLTQSVWIFYIKTSALHAIPLECEMKNEKVVNEFMYYYIWC